MVFSVPLSGANCAIPWVYFTPMRKCTVLRSGLPQQYNSFLRFDRFEY